MKNILYILKRDLKRIFTNKTAIIVLLGVFVLPSFYAWVNIYAFMDPYSNVEDMKIAISNCDKGTHQELLGDLDVGRQIEEQLKENKVLDWVFVSEDKAIEGVKAGDYYAALIIPENFSEDIVSIVSGDISKPEIDYYVNEKINTLAPKVTDTGAQTIQETIDAQFRGIVAGSVTDALKKITKESVTEIDNSEAKLLTSIDEARKCIADYNAAIGSTNSVFGYSKKVMRDSRSLANSAGKGLSAVNRIIGTDSKMINVTLDDVHNAQDDIYELREKYPDLPHDVTDLILKKLNQLEASLISVDTTLAESKALVTALKPSVKQINDMLDSANEGLGHAGNSIDDMSDALAATDSLLKYSRNSLAALGSNENFKSLQEIMGADAGKITEVVKAPINLKTEALYPVKNYGSGMAPFFTMLAIWISGLVLIALFKLEVDTDDIKERNITLKEAYIGRGLLLTVICLIQATITCIGDLLLGIQCLDPVAFVFAGLVSSVVFVNLIYALAVAFRHVGKAIAVILVIIQIPGSSGTFPLELAGPFFQSVYPALPFSYGIDAMREAIAGYYGNEYGMSLLHLLVFFVIALIIGLVLRPQMAAINHTFDTKLNETGILSSETNLGEQQNVAVKAAVRAMYSGNVTREALEKRISLFENFYEKMQKHGLLYVALIVLVLIVLLFALPASPVLMCIWVICIIAVAFSLFFIEHIHLAIAERKYSEGGDRQ